MDKKNTIIGVLLLLAGFASLYLFPHQPPPPRTAPPPTAPVATTPATAQPATASAATPAPAPIAPTAPAANGAFAALARKNAEATVTRIGNDFLEVRLIDFGGAIQDVAFKHYHDRQGSDAPYVFNQLHAAPILSFTETAPAGWGSEARYERVSATGTEAVFRAVIDGRLEITRRYAVLPAGAAKGEPYVVRHETTFRNLGTEALPVPRAFLGLGTASLVNENDYGQYLNISTYDGKDAVYTDRGDLEGAGFFGRMLGRDPTPRAYIEKPGNVVWASVKNQFFASIYRPDQPGTGVIVRRIELPPFAGTQRPNVGLTGAASFASTLLAPGASTTLAGNLYAGPKEYRRLVLLGHNEDLVMQYSRYFYNRIFLCGYVAPLMYTLMNGTHGWVNDWGIAIILMTLILKTVTLPFTIAASRSAKRMQKFQPELQAIREKFKDNPQKLQAETMRVFKEHKINPMGGCLPILITIPLFIGFFIMLQGTAELRFQSFLWARDLSAPDTVMRIFGLPLNIMPILMGATMIVQMRLTPQPTVDNAQAKMLKFMPYFFALICYNFSCALALYSTINGLFTIGQQLVINRMKDTATDQPAGKTAAPAGRAAAPAAAPKGVTPAKKKGRK